MAIFLEYGLTCPSSEYSTSPVIGPYIYEIHLSIWTTGTEDACSTYRLLYVMNLNIVTILSYWNGNPFDSWLKDIF